MLLVVYPAVFQDDSNLLPKLYR